MMRFAQPWFLSLLLLLPVLAWLHGRRGRKPAFVDDVMGLVVGPLFVVAELAFLLGLRKEVERAVVESAGPTCIREKKALA